MQPNFPDVSELVPHRGRMCLISCVLEEADDKLVVGVDVASDNPFLVQGKGVPAYVGLEMMAQTICAKDGLNQRRNGHPPMIGFLLGCQRYRTYQDWLMVGEPLSAHVRCRLDAGELASFECKLRTSAGAIVAEGTISVFRPRDVEKFLADREVKA